ncbi:MAG: MarR family transcriptional regulator [Algoriphagus sp.]|uniref:MarR family winged helix-turn-helix transcriptional regulator n=1 Tax=Algoriphagus sp. TaxID=1872435 RepID=UPI00260DA56E|nr:MarR family transcriptional regulator [Algoriphagus sp.]MDG1276277.1 MarR family transcriptional regulator [Algoriphagus sp.]
MNASQDLALHLYSSSRIFIQLITSRLTEFGLTYPQYLVLAVLWKEDGLRVNEIGQRLELDSGTLTPLLKKLEAMNYVKRQRGEADERTVTAELTYPGKSLQSKVEASLMKFDELLSEFLDLSLDSINQSLLELLDSLKSLKNSENGKT